jgi:hypothetical protein
VLPHYGENVSGTAGTFFIPRGICSEKPEGGSAKVITLEYRADYVYITRNVFDTQ